MAEVLNRKSVPSSSKEWQCPHCTVVNSATDMDCRICTKQRPGRQQLQHHLKKEQDKLPEGGPVKQSFVDNVKSLVLRKPLPWRCPRCTLELGGYYTKCTACGYLKTDIRRKSETSMLDWFTKLRRSPDRRGIAHQASSVDPDRDSGYQEGAGWSCGRCTYKNEEKAKICEVCQNRKPSQQKLDDTKTKENRHQHMEESFEVIGSEDEGYRVTPSFTDDNSPTLQDQNNFSQVQYPSDPASVTVPTEPSVLVLPSPPFSPKHKSLPSPATPQPHPQPHPSSSSTSCLLSADGQPKSQTAVLNNINAPSWKCSVCGAFNLIFAPKQKCYVCGIGLIPPLYNDVETTNNHARPRSLVVHGNPLPKVNGADTLVYTKHPNAATVMPLPPGHDCHHQVSDAQNGGQVVPQQPARVTPAETKRGQGSGTVTRKRRRNNSVRRSFEDSIGTPSGNTTVLLRVVRHQYELEADRIYKEICQYCKHVSVASSGYYY